MRIERLGVIGGGAWGIAEFAEEKQERARRGREGGAAAVVVPESNNW